MVHWSLSIPSWLLHPAALLWGFSFPSSLPQDMCVQEDEAGVISSLLSPPSLSARPAKHLGRVSNEWLTIALTQLHQNPWAGSPYPLGQLPPEALCSNPEAGEMGCKAPLLSDLQQDTPSDPSVNSH